MFWHKYSNILVEKWNCWVHSQKCYNLHALKLRCLIGIQTWKQFVLFQYIYVYSYIVGAAVYATVFRVLFSSSLVTSGLHWRLGLKWCFSQCEPLSYSAIIYLFYFDFQIFDEADLDDDSQLSFAEFEHVISKAPDFVK